MRTAAVAASALALALAGCGGSESAKVEKALRDSGDGRVIGADLDTVSCSPIGDGEFTCQAETVLSHGGPVVWSRVRLDGDRVYATTPR